jgi:hypothetical protein
MAPGMGWKPICRRIYTLIAESERQVGYVRKRFRSTLISAGGGRHQAQSDVNLQRHLHEVIYSLPTPTTDVTVEVIDGKAILRGQVHSDRQRAEMRATVAAVAGVPAQPHAGRTSGAD